MDPEQNEPKPSFRPAAPEREHTGSIWTHPYLIYVALTMVLFGVLVLLAWLALSNDWIPTR